jgi:hypothetical protein
MNDQEIEIYRQRYETFRHLDKLRWQMLQFLIAIGTATALVIRSTPGPLDWWFFCLIGGSLVAISSVMFRISSGQRKNSVVLREAGEAVGDNGITDISNPYKTIGHWLMLAIGTLGLGLIVWGLTLVEAAE